MKDFVVKYCTYIMWATALTSFALLAFMLSSNLTSNQNRLIVLTQICLLVLQQWSAYQRNRSGRL